MTTIIVIVIKLLLAATVLFQPAFSVPLLLVFKYLFLIIREAKLK